MRFITKGGLQAPEGFWRLKPSEYKKICNGAGPKHFGWLVPDTFYGLRITKAADIHDYMVHLGWDWDAAARVFYDNLIVLIEQAGGKWERLRKIRANTYRMAVKYVGRWFY